MAGQSGRLPDPRFRDDAGSNDGDGRHSLFRAFPGPVPRRGRAGRRRRNRGAQGLGGVRLLPPGQAASRGGPDDRARARRRDPRRPRGGPGLAGSRPLHRGCDLIIRIRSSRANRRSEQSARPGAPAGSARRLESGATRRGSGRPPSVWYRPTMLGPSIRRSWTWVRRSARRESLPA